MHYYGYVVVAHDTYATWYINTIGNFYNVDYLYGSQCWDFCATFHYSVGFPQNYPLTGSTGSAYECWTDHKFDNIAYNGTQYFDLIYNKEDIKKGDIVVFNYTASNPAGHIAFANEDYTGSQYLSCLGQNQGGTPDPQGGANVNVANQDLSLFLGAFRYRAWHEPTPVSQNKYPKFKWVLHARKLRERRAS